MPENKVRGSTTSLILHRVAGYGCPNSISETGPGQILERPPPACLAQYIDTAAGLLGRGKLRARSAIELLLLKASQREARRCMRLADLVPAKYQASNPYGSRIKWGLMEGATPWNW